MIKPKCLRPAPILGRSSQPCIPKSQCLARPLTTTARRSSFFHRNNETTPAPPPPPGSADRDAADGASRPAPIADNNVITPRIHILGLGNLGSFIAHSLRTLPNPPPVTLLLHSEEQYQGWKLNQRRITLHTHGLGEHSKGYDVSILRDGRWYNVHQPPTAMDDSHGEFDGDGDAEATALRGAREAENDAASHAMKDTRSLDTSKIDNLIVTVKTTQIGRAMESIHSRLTPRSTIVLLQNGLGVKEEIDTYIFPNADTRPNYISGTVSHGLTSVRSFEVVHAGIGSIKLGLVHTNRVLLAHARASKTSILRSEDEAVYNEPNNQWAHKPPLFMPSSAQYLLSLLTSSPALIASTLSKPSLLQAQLEKLAANCLVNPLSVIFDCPNGDLLYNNHVTRIQRLLLLEICSVICAMPELQSVPGLHARFGPERLYTITTALQKQTAENLSSMLQDVRADKQTEIGYMNGYIVRKGEQLGMKCVANYMLMQMVLGKSRSQSKKLAGQIPFDHL